MSQYTIEVFDGVLELLELDPVVQEIDLEVQLTANEVPALLNNILQAGAGATLTFDATAGTITIAATGGGGGGGFTQEQIEDFVAGLIVDSGVLDWTYNDAAVPATLTGTVKPGSITETMLAFAVATQGELDAQVTALQAADNARILLSEKGAANGVATLGPTGVMPSNQLPPLAIHEWLADVASEAAMLALTGQRGDVAVRTDFDPDRVYMLLADDPTVITNWKYIGSFGGVVSVNGQAGVVVIPEDGPAGTPSLRSLGIAATQALPGNHPSTTNQRVPTDDSVSTVKLQDASVTTPKVADNGITLAKLVDIATGNFLGRVSPGVGDPELITPVQAKTLLAVTQADVQDLPADLQILANDVLGARGAAVGLPAPFFLAAKALTDIEVFVNWCKVNNVGGYIGEVGWPYDNLTPGDGHQWNALGERIYRILNAAGMWATYWMAGARSNQWEYSSVYAGLGTPGPTSALNTARGQAVVIENPDNLSVPGGYQRGVNLWDGGMSFNMYWKGNTNGDVFGSGDGWSYDYGIPEDFAFLAARGHKVVRTRVLWERIQPTLGGPLDATELTRLTDAIAAAGAEGIGTILHVANNGVRYETPNLLTDNESAIVTNVTPWTPINATLARVTTNPPPNSTASMQITANGAGNGSAFSQDIPVSPGITYRVTAKFRPITGTLRNVWVTVVWKDANHVQIAAPTTAPLTEVAGVYTEAVGDFLAPVGTSYVQLITAVATPANGELHQVGEIGVMAPGSTVWVKGGPLRWTNNPRPTVSIIGGSDGVVTQAHFDDLWSRLSTAFAANADVVAYGLMNEPAALTVANWHTYSQSALNAIRATGDTKLIMVPGGIWSGAATWAADQGAPWILDPADNFKYEAHYYFERAGKYANPIAIEERIAKNEAPRTFLNVDPAAVALTVQGAPGQIGSLLDLKKGDGASTFFVDKDGAVTAMNFFIATKTGGTAASVISGADAGWFTIRGYLEAVQAGVTVLWLKAATSQTANILNAVNASSVTMVAIANDGGLKSNKSAVFKGTAITDIPLTLQVIASQTAKNFDVKRVDATSALSIMVNGVINTYADDGTTAALVLSAGTTPGSFTRLLAQSIGTGVIAGYFNGANGQTVDIMEILLNGVLKQRVNKAGYAMNRMTAAPILGDLVDGEGTWITDTAGNAVKFYVRIGGVLKSATLAVA